MAARDVKFDKEKLLSAILYIVQNTRPDRLGAVKLHKVLYYADMMTFLETGRAITGTVYRKRPFGPASNAVLHALDELSGDGRLEIEWVDYHGFQKMQFSAAVLTDTNALSKAELETLDEMIDFVCNANSARTISELSHDLPWQMVEFGDVMPYHNAISMIPSFPSDDDLEWAAEEVKRVETARAGSDKVEDIDPATFRGRVAEMRRVRQI
jgi:hypothetical protein